MQKIEIKRTLFNRIPKLVLAAGMGTLTVTACSNGVEKTTACTTYTANGTPVLPKAWPKRGTDVLFSQQGEYPFVDYEDLWGSVEHVGNHLVLNVKDMPPLKQLAPVEGFRSDGEDISTIAAQIDTPQTGKIGFTLACISKGIDANNIPTTYIQLPS